MSLLPPAAVLRRLSFALGVLMVAACSADGKRGADGAPTQAGTQTTTAGTPTGTTAGTTAGTTSGTTSGVPATTAGTPPPPVNNAPAVAWPALDFVNDPAGNDPKAVALSFDDGPDGAGSPEGKATGKSNTSRVLDVLKDSGLKATFFVCGNKWTNVRQDPLAVADLKRIIAEGHTLANHTYTHRTFDPNVTDPNDAAGVNAAGAAQELANNEAVLRDPAVLGSAAPEMSLYRAPYGTPFQDTLPAVAAMAPATAAYGVHAGWGIDPQDWLCAGNKQDVSCIMTTLNRYLDKNASGVILMHSVYKLTADALPQVIAAIKAKGYHFVMVEDFVRAKYGASSADMRRAQNAAKFSDSAIVESAMKSIAVSKWNLGTNE